MPSAVASSVHEALTILIDQVQAEFEKETAVSLAGEIFDSRGLDSPPGTSAPHLWDALKILSASMMVT
jgi:hypothetical protein